MLIDITLPVTPEMLATAWTNTAKSLVGHLGTHFDVMDKEFPLEYTARKAVVFDVSHIRDREITPSDVALEQVGADMFVAFYTGYVHEVEYGTSQYFKEHPQLSEALIDALLEQKVSIIGIDCAAIRKGEAHIPTDQRCADHGVFVVENLWGLDAVLAAGAKFTARTYPMRFAGVTGLPCRVVAEV